MIKRLFLFLLITFPLYGFTATLGETLNKARSHFPQTSEPTVLPADQAFQYTILVNTQKNQLDIHWTLAKDYYLYRNKFAFTTSLPLSYTLSDGTEIRDEFFGKQRVYFNNLAVTIPLPKELPTTFPLKVSYQGCASAGFCYPPQTNYWQIDSKTGTVTPVENIAEDVTQEINKIAELGTTPSAVTQLLEQSNMGWALLIFYALGLLLTFTPCVLPMIPILSSIIVGQHTPPRSWHGFTLSLSYVFGVIITYTAAGVFAGLAGQTLQSYLQAPLFIALSALLLALLALSLFDCYRLQLPSRWHNALNNSTQHMRGGRYVSAFLLGILSALIVSPCVTAPLIGALTYISITGDAIFGGGALFFLALGMGTPLLILGALGPGLLPQAGDWILVVQRVFGVLLLCVAIWLLARILPAHYIAVLWGVLAIIVACYLGAWQTAVTFGWMRFWQGIAWILFLFGALILIRAGQPLLDNWFPPTHSNITVTSTTSNFIPVKTLADVQQHAKQSKKPVLLDIYADWCITCKIIEQRIFPDPQVASLLQQFTLLRADVTLQDADNLELQKQLKIFAPPALLFFAPGGEELTDARLVGELTPAVLAERLKVVLESKQ